MAIAFRNKNTTTNTASATSQTITPPTGTQLDDLLLLVLTTDATGSTHATPSGWTALPVTGLNLADGANGHKVSAWWKKAVAADVSLTTFSLTWTGANTNSTCIAGWSGVDTTTPLDVNNTTFAQGAFSASPSASSYAAISPTSTNTMIVVLGSSSCGTGTSNPALSTSSGMTIRAEAHVANCFAYSFIADVAQAASGSSGTKSFTWTLTSETFCQSGYTVALRAGSTTFMPDEDAYKPPVLNQDNAVSVWS